MVEITASDSAHGHFVRADTLDAFRSPIDGTLIDSRSKLEDHCARHGVVPTQELAGAQKAVDRYAGARQDRALREQLWQRVDQAMHRRR